MILLNYLYFLIITYFGIKFLFTGGGMLKSPFDKNVKMRLNGPEMFWCLTFSTGLLAFSAPGALDLMAIRLMVLEVLCFAGIFVAKDKPIWSLPLIIYAIYLLWIVIGCFYSPAPAYGIRVVLKYLYPLLLCLFASAAVRYAEVFLKSALLARLVALISVIFAFVPLISHIIPGVIWEMTARAINYISMMVLSLGLFYFSNEKKKNLIYAIIFILPCFIWVFRTSIVGSFIALVIFFFFRYNIKALPIMFGTIVLCITLMFAIPSVRDKMFYNSEGKNTDMLYSGEIKQDDIDSNGRFAMWEWATDRFYDEHELTGVGTGNLQETFYALRHPFGTIRICHNDYVQILCDNGLLGVALYCGSFLFIIMHCFQIYNQKRISNYIKLCAIVAAASLAGVMFTSFTDNSVNYTMATYSMPFGFYGMMLGMKKQAELA